MPIESRDAPMRPAALRDASARREPPLEDREQEQADARADHRAGALWHPSFEPEDVARSCVQIGQHLARGKRGHPHAVHVVHVVLIRVEAPVSVRVRRRW